MDYARPELADRLAAEYVLGTLRGPARRRFQVLQAAHPALQRAVLAWEERLGPLQHQGLAPVQPPAVLWTRVQDRLFAPPPAAAPVLPPGLWRRLRLWQGLAVAGLLASVVLGLRAPGPALPDPQIAQQPAPGPAPQPDPIPAPLPVAQAPQPAEPPRVLLLQAQPQPAGSRQAPVRFAAALSPDGQALVLRPIDPPRLRGGRSLELWAVPAAGAPRSLGVVELSGVTTVRQSRLLDGTAAFALSLEPAGGSPTGGPTGPVLAVGSLDAP